MNYSQEAVHAACVKYGQGLAVKGLLDSFGQPIEGDRLLWAISGQESSFGADCGPRFEPGYWDGEESRNPEQAALNTKYGRAAAMSYGPWQIMYVNGWRYGTPDDLNLNLDVVAQATVDFMNDYVIGHQRAHNLQEFARIYNSGNKTEPLTLGVMRYIENVSRFYEKGFLVSA